MKRLLFFPLVLVLVNCSADPPVSVGTTVSASPGANSRGVQHIINVSAYDPKERSRSGRSYSASDLSALRANGARGLIARAGKGGKLDEKCGSFIAAADRAGLLAGVYYRVQRHVSITRQADQLVSHAKALSRRRPAGVAPLLLCGDYDGDLTVSQILTFMDRVEQKTGVVPVSYLENSEMLKIRLSSADARSKAKLKRAPYWIALYSHESGNTARFPPPGSPENLVKQYDVWSDWSLWQYGGVSWENRASRAKVYHHGRYRFPPYFGNMDRPMERNIFRGSYKSLVSFWSRHGLR